MHGRSTKQRRAAEKRRAQYKKIQDAIDAEWKLITYEQGLKAWKNGNAKSAPKRRGTR